MRLLDIRSISGRERPYARLWGMEVENSLSRVDYLDQYAIGYALEAIAIPSSPSIEGICGIQSYVGPKLFPLALEVLFPLLFRGHDLAGKNHAGRCAGGCLRDEDTSQLTLSSGVVHLVGIIDRLLKQIVTSHIQDPIDVCGSYRSPGSLDWFLGRVYVYVFSQHSVQTLGAGFESLVTSSRTYYRYLCSLTLNLCRVPYRSGICCYLADKETKITV